MKASWIWIFFIPLLYLPNLAPSDTGFGVIELSDFIIVPLLIILVLLPKRRASRIMARGLIYPGMGFVLWCLLGILFIYLRFQYNDTNRVILFSLLKLAKFTLYAMTPLIISGRLINDSIREDFNWSLLGCCLILGSSVLFESGFLQGKTITEKQSAFKSLNLISTCMAILITYLSALLISNVGSAKWRFACKICMAVILLGFTLTQGRGGWIAAMAGFTFMGYKHGLLRTRTLIAIFSIFVASTTLYFSNKEFQFQIDRTFFPEKQFIAKDSTAAVLGVDDGYRIAEWANQAYRFWRSPILGAGFYHRTQISGLSSSGSHNFWLQMFLETGLVGGLLMIYLFGRMWKQANSMAAKENKLDLALSSSLVTAFVAGITGEYFYGSLGLFTILLVYAPMGSLSASKKADGGGSSS